MKHLFKLILLSTFCLSLSVENAIPKQGFTFHVGGAATLFEAEYQYRFIVNDKHAFSACIGINTLGLNIGFPLGFNYTYGQKNQLLAGIRFVPNLLFDSLDPGIEGPFWSFLANLRIGYGRELLLFKQTYVLYVYASPFLNIDSGMALPWAGIGLTYNF